MKENLRLLLELQDIALSIAQLGRDADALNIDVRNAERALEDKKHRRELVHKERLDATAKADALQMQIEEAEQKIAQLEIQLNQLSNIDRIRTSMAGHRADIEKWEDEALGALQKVDELSAQEKQLEQEVRQAEEELQRVRQNTAQEREEFEDRLAMLQHKSETLRRQIEPQVLAVYDRLASGRRNNPLATVKGQTCQGCYSRVPPQTINLLLRDDKIVYCHSCGRMLMLDEKIE